MHAQQFHRRKFHRHRPFVLFLPGAGLSKVYPSLNTAGPHALETPCTVSPIVFLFIFAPNLVHSFLSYFGMVSFHRREP